MSNNEEEVQFKAKNDQEHHLDGYSSPPLWKSRSRRSPLRPLHVHKKISLSPNSRIEAITQGQRELMEMVNNMQESTYELSLKDLIVERDHPPTPPPPPPQPHEEINKRWNSIGFEDKGMFLNVVVPFSVKRNSFGGSKRIAPKIEEEEVAVVVEKGGGWWFKKKIFNIRNRRSNGGESDRRNSWKHASSSITSKSAGGDSDGSNSGNHTPRKYRESDPKGCWSFLLLSGRQKPVQQAASI